MWFSKNILLHATNLALQTCFAFTFHRKHTTQYRPFQSSLHYIQDLLGWLWGLLTGQNEPAMSF